MLGDGQLQRRFGHTLLAPRLWRLSRHSVAGGIAVGLFCGLIPGPLQMLGAAIAAYVFRVNLPLALFSTLYTNPLTIIPLYLLAFSLGQWVVGDGTSVFIAPPEIVFSDFMGSMTRVNQWVASLGKPLVVGLFMLASLLSATGYLLIYGLWQLHIVRYLRQRRQRAQANRLTKTGGG